MTLQPVEPMPLPPAVLEIARTLEQARFETWCVGGGLRYWRPAPKQATVVPIPRPFQTSSAPSVWTYRNASPSTSAAGT